MKIKINFLAISSQWNDGVNPVISINKRSRTLNTSHFTDKIRFTVIDNRVALLPDDNMDPAIAIAWTTAADSNILRVSKVAVLADDNMDPAIAIAWTTAADSNMLRVNKVAVLADDNMDPAIAIAWTGWFQHDLGWGKKKN